MRNALFCRCTPYSGWAGTQTSLEFLYGHGMIPDWRKAEIDEACGAWYERAPPGPYEAPPAKCAALLEDLYVALRESFREVLLLERHSEALLEGLYVALPECLGVGFIVYDGLQ